jgi:hypothetical protein
MFFAVSRARTAPARSLQNIFSFYRLRLFVVSIFYARVFPKEAFVCPRLLAGALSGFLLSQGWIDGIR